MSRPPLTAEQRTALDHRQRGQVLAGLAVSIAQKGYAATTIADIAREARTSKSTVYAHFADKHDCLLALYSAATDNLLEAIVRADEQAAARGLAWPERVRTGVRAYVQAMADGPALARASLIEIQAAGPRALELRRDVLRRYADLARRISRDIAREHAGVRALTPALALAAIGAVNELMLEAVEAGDDLDLAELTDTAAGVYVALLARP